jgi:hypothetical protein
MQPLRVGASQVEGAGVWAAPGAHGGASNCDGDQPPAGIVASGRCEELMTVAALRYTRALVEGLSLLCGRLLGVEALVVERLVVALELRVAVAGLVDVKHAIVALQTSWVRESKHQR